MIFLFAISLKLNNSPWIMKYVIVIIFLKMFLTNVEIYLIYK